MTQQAATLNAKQSQLVMVDVQERLAPVMCEMEAMTHNATVLLKAAKHLAVPLLVSEQYRKGLGATIAPLMALVGNDGAQLEKMHFSCWQDDAMKAHLLNEKERGCGQFVLFGIEAHICVAQTALDLAGAGERVFVVADAITSRTPQSVALAVERMRAAGCAIVSTEMVLFEWLGVSGTDDFKALSKLVK